MKFELHRREVMYVTYLDSHQLEAAYLKLLPQTLRDCVPV